MLFMLMGGRKLPPETFISLRQAYLTTVRPGGVALPVRQVQMLVLCHGGSVAVSRVSGVMLVSSEV
ncbi:hypothetical protein [Citrobacter meridianamericanus]|uniref:hypothetical protein n=1 Tax=Citrobacter meridianamericanus TaxID=2894201 RepID=UPI00351D443D